MSHEFNFRPVRPNDYDEVRQIHLKLFPLQYSDQFLRKACQGIGLNDGPLFSSVVTLYPHDNTIIGFLFCQLIDRDTCEEAHALDAASDSAKTCYILTLGLLPPYRRSGLGKMLLSRCLDFACACPDCGMVMEYQPSTIALN